MWGPTNFIFEQGVRHELSQESMQVNVNRFHFVATCWPKNEGASSMSNLGIRRVKCKCGERFELRNLGLFEGLYKENGYSL